MRKGERAISLYMPVTVKRASDPADDPADDPQVFTRFIYRSNWFVLAQTDGPDVPAMPIPSWDRHVALAALNVNEVPFDACDGNVLGFAPGRSIAISPLNPLPHKTPSMRRRSQTRRIAAIHDRVGLSRSVNRHPREGRPSLGNLNPICGIKPAHVKITSKASLTQEEMTRRNEPGLAELIWAMLVCGALTPLGWFIRCRCCWRGRCRTIIGRHHGGRLVVLRECRVCDARPPSLDGCGLRTDRTTSKRSARELSTRNAHPGGSDRAEFVRLVKSRAKVSNAHIHSCAIPQGAEPSNIDSANLEVIMKTNSSRLGTLGLGFALILFWASPPAEAATITSVVVTSNGITYNAASVGWSFPITLLAGQDLVLSQDLQGVPNSTTSFNFDTSDNVQTALPSIPQIAITADGVTTIFNDTNQVLNVKNQGSVDLDLNEAQNYGLGLVGPGYLVFLGYADNVHPGVCGAYATSIGLLGSSTCLPSPFAGATFFQGRGGINPLAETNSFHCAADGSPTCYEGAAIRIVGTSAAVPEPATMTLMLTALAGLIARRRGQIRKSRGTKTVLD